MSQSIKELEIRIYVTCPGYRAAHGWMLGVRRPTSFTLYSFPVLEETTT